MIEDHGNIIIAELSGLIYPKTIIGEVQGRSIDTIFLKRAMSFEGYNPNTQEVSFTPLGIFTRNFTESEKVALVFNLRNSLIFFSDRAKDWVAAIYLNKVKDLQEQCYWQET